MTELDEPGDCTVGPIDDPVPDDELAFWVLSPDGDPERIEEYGRLFGRDDAQ